MVKFCFVFSLFFLFCGFISSAQTSTDKNPYTSRVIAKYYSKEELQFIETNHPEKFKKIKYYYLHSFIVSDMNCTTCPDYNPELIDIREYNHLRKPYERVTITNEEFGYRVTLLSEQEVEQLIKKDSREIETSTK